MEHQQEHWWSVAELKAAWNMSDDSVRRWIKDEPGVVEFTSQKRGCERRITRRVPDAVKRRIEEKYRIRPIS